MTIKHRIDRLENDHLPSKQRIYLIVSKYDETGEEAKQQYCAKTGISTGELKAPDSRVMMVRFRKPGDAVNAIANNA
jgi:hypothetical protein